MNGKTYMYDRLGSAQPDGSFSRTQFAPDEILMTPGLIYKAKPENDVDTTPPVDDGSKFVAPAAPDAASGSLAIQQVIGRLVGFYAFHWWRIATLRPAFELMSDRKQNLLIFAGLYWFFGVLQSTLMVDRTLWSSTLSSFATTAIVCAWALAPRRSLSLASGLFAAGCADRLLVLCDSLTGLGVTTSSVFRILMMLMMVFVVKAFFAAPPDVRLRGYTFSATGLQERPQG